MLKDQPQPLVNHLIELRKRFLISFCIFALFFLSSYFFSKDLFQFLAQPLLDIFKNSNGTHRLIYTNLTEAFSTYLKVGAFFGFLFSFPFIAHQLWLFIAPGLYKEERKTFFLFLFFAPFLFLCGAAFAYYVVCPTAYKFFLSFETPNFSNLIPIQLEAKLNEYLSLVIRLVLAFGISFQLPVILSLLAYVGILSYKTLMDKWRYAVLGIFTLSAFITPPDALSMILLALPLVLIYFMTVFIVKCVERSKKT